MKYIFIILTLLSFNLSALEITQTWTTGSNHSSGVYSVDGYGVNHSVVDKWGTDANTGSGGVDNSVSKSFVSHEETLTYDSYQEDGVQVSNGGFTAATIGTDNLNAGQSVGYQNDAKAGLVQSSSNSTSWGVKSSYETSTNGGAENGAASEIVSWVNQVDRDYVGTSFSNSSTTIKKSFIQ